MSNRTVSIEHFSNVRLICARSSKRVDRSWTREIHSRGTCRSTGEVHSGAARSGACVALSGMGACQLRSGESQTRHMYLVFLAYSALMTQLRHDRAQEWAHIRLTTIGESCRAMFRETLGKTIAWVVEQVAQGQSLPAIKAHLALP